MPEYVPETSWLGIRTEIRLGVRGLGEAVVTCALLVAGFVRRAWHRRRLF